MERKRVFILGGGASLGAHQVGALKYLDERGIRPDAVVGSSIGVVNACLLASGGVENVERAWLDFPRMSKVFRPSLAHNPFSGLSLFSMDPLARAIERYVDFERVHRSPMELSFILLNLSRGEGQFVSNRKVDDPKALRLLMRAGYAVPVLFPPVRYRGELFVDGGFAWNVPLSQAVEMGATEIYLLSVVATSLPYATRFRSMPQYLTRLMDVLWRTLGNVGYVTTRIDEDGSYRGVPVTVVTPTEELAGFQPLSLLSTSVRRTRRLITLGYRDAKRELVRQHRTRRQRPEELPSLEVEPAYLHQVARQAGRDAGRGSA